jgi:hypothetical protein
MSLFSRQALLKVQYFIAVGEYAKKRFRKCAKGVQAHTEIATILEWISFNKVVPKYAESI